MSADYRHRDAHLHRTRGVLRLALGVSVLASVAAGVFGCGEPQPPVAVGSIPDLTVDPGSSDSVDVAGYFSDPDGDSLSYMATSDFGLATASVSEGTVTVSGVSHGIDTVTVTATDPDGLSATQAFMVTVRLTERQVLEVLYDELGGYAWINITNWKTDEPLGEWYGVSTDADGRVAALDLHNNSLTGEIPTELGSLSSLEHLSLRNNSLSGEIPLELGSLSSLETLFLYNNSMTGEIPPELGDLRNLRDLRLANNSLTGEIPPELGDASNLEYLSLASNSLAGGIPPDLGDLSYLEHLDLSDNSLTGEIPPELGSLSNLGSMFLYDNLLTGEMPLDFLDLSLLWRFYWDDNDGFCAPNTVEFDDWLDGLDVWLGRRCD